MEEEEEERRFLVKWCLTTGEEEPTSVGANKKLTASALIPDGKMVSSVVWSAMGQEVNCPSLIIGRTSLNENDVVSVDVLVVVSGTFAP